MNNLLTKLKQRTLRQRRIRATVKGTADRPRLSVRITNRHVIAQVIDDTTGKTLAYSTTSADAKAAGNLSEKAAKVGADIAKKAKAAKVNKVVFDRNGKMYHGRVKALADAAREAGLEF